MNMNGAEYDVFSEILKHTEKLTGIVLELHKLHKSSSVKKAVHLLEEIEKNFVLVHVHGNNIESSTWSAQKVKKGAISTTLELSYINKNLLSSYVLSPHQKSPTSLDMPNLPNHPDIEFELLMPKPTHLS